MNDVLKSLKADLTSRRMLPLLVLVIAALVAAGAYAALSGGSSGATPVAAVPVTPAPSSSGAGTGSTALASAAPADPTAADAETTSGARYQHQGGAHNPFIGLPRPARKIVGPRQRRLVGERFEEHIGAIGVTRTIRQFQTGAPVGRHRLHHVPRLERRSPPPARGGRSLMFRDCAPSREFAHGAFELHVCSLRHRIPRDLRRYAYLQREQCVPATYCRQCSQCVVTSAPDLFRCTC